MKTILKRLSTAFHQIFTYLNLIDVHQNLSISNFTLYISFITTLIMLWLNVDIIRISIMAGFTLLCFINYGYRRWMNASDYKLKEQIDKLTVELATKTNECQLVTKELDVLKARMNIGHSPEGSPFRGRNMPA